MFSTCRTRAAKAFGSQKPLLSLVTIAAMRRRNQQSKATQKEYEWCPAVTSSKLRSRYEKSSVAVHLNPWLVPSRELWWREYPTTDHSFFRQPGCQHGDRRNALQLHGHCAGLVERGSAHLRRNKIGRAHV